MWMFAAAGLWALAIPGTAVKNVPPVTTALPGFAWQVVVTDFSSKQTETRVIKAAAPWSLGTISCQAEPSTPERTGSALQQRLTLTCKAGSVIAGSAALCRQSSDDANQPRLVLEGIMHFVFGVDGAPPGGVQFETRCLPAAP